MSVFVVQAETKIWAWVSWMHLQFPLMSWTQCVFCGFENGVHHFISVLLLAHQCCYNGATSTFGNVVIILYCSLTLRCSLVRAACGNNSSAVQNLNEWIFSSAVILNGSKGQGIMVFMSHSTFRNLVSAQVALH